MTPKMNLIAALALAAVFLFSACERAAPGATPAATPTQGVQGVPQAIGGGVTQDPSIGLTQIASWTSVAASGTAAVTPTPNVTQIPEATALTPVPSATPTSLLPPTGAPTLLPTVPVATAARPATYTLKPGEFPYCIARRFNVDPIELLTLNGLGSGEVFQPGLVLKIPQTGKPFPGQRFLVPHPATYVVKANDTIYKIACYFGDVDPLAIAASNNLVSPYTLTPGQTLNIP